MKLTLEIVSQPSDQALQGQKFEFPPEGGTIGRAQGHTLTLPDNVPIVSTNHATIQRQGAGYVLLDHSTNGTFINGSPTPVPPHQPTPLKESDQLAIGEYLLKVALQADAAVAAGGDSFLDNMQPAPPASAAQPEPPPAPPPQASAPAAEGANSEIEALLRRPAPRAREPEFRSSPAVSPNPAPDVNLHEQVLDPMRILNPQGAQGSGLVDPPAAGKIMQPQQVDPAPAHPMRQAMTPRAAVAIDTEKPVSTAGSGFQGAVLLADLMRAELGIENLTEEEAAVLLPEILRTFAMTVGRVVQILAARREGKKAMGAEVTILGAQDGNPLKFANDVSEALRVLLMQRDGRFLSPEEAVRDSFDDLEDHQMAILAGMREAYSAMLAAFNPKHFSSGKGGGLGALPGGKKVQAWEAFEQFYAELQADPDLAYNRLFGDAYSEHYETQERLMKSRRRGLPE
jgi:type VI secretion system FHA domain protein